jgi:hypothetical protein
MILREQAAAAADALAYWSMVPASDNGEEKAIAMRAANAVLRRWKFKLIQGDKL